MGKPKHCLAGTSFILAGSSMTVPIDHSLSRTDLLARITEGEISPYRAMVETQGEKAAIALEVVRKAIDRR